MIWSDSNYISQLWPFHADIYIFHIQPFSRKVSDGSELLFWQLFFRSKGSHCEQWKAHYHHNTHNHHFFSMIAPLIIIYSVLINWWTLSNQSPPEILLCFACLCVLSAMLTWYRAPDISCSYLQSSCGRLPLKQTASHILAAEKIGLLVLDMRRKWRRSLLWVALLVVGGEWGAPVRGPGMRPPPSSAASAMAE